MFPFVSVTDIGNHDWSPWETQSICDCHNNNPRRLSRAINTEACPGSAGTTCDGSGHLNN